MNAKIREMVDAGYAVDVTKRYYPGENGDVETVMFCETSDNGHDYIGYSFVSKQAAINECYAEWKRVTG